MHPFWIFIIWVLSLIVFYWLGKSSGRDDYFVLWSMANARSNEYLSELYNLQERIKYMELELAQYKSLPRVSSFCRSHKDIYEDT